MSLILLFKNHTYQNTGAQSVQDWSCLCQTRCQKLEIHLVVVYVGSFQPDFSSNGNGTKILVVCSCVSFTRKLIERAEASGSLDPEAQTVVYANF